MILTLNKVFFSFPCRHLWARFHEKSKHFTWLKLKKFSSLMHPGMRIELMKFQRITFTWGLEIPLTISWSSRHQETLGAGRAPAASHWTSWGCPAERDSLTPSSRIDDGPTEIQKRDKFFVILILIIHQQPYECWFTFSLDTLLWEKNWGKDCGR